MLISSKKKFIFIHIYKTAGTSVNRALTPFTNSRYVNLINAFSKKFNNGKKIFQDPFEDHISSSELIEKIGEEKFNSHYSFAFVRNPWDWHVSIYKFTLKTPSHPQHTLFKSLGSFERYVEWRCEHEVLFQKDFVYSKSGELLVDYVGRFENVESDFKHICERLQINAKLQKLNVSNTKPYQEFYTERTKSMIAETFKPDIEIFNYSFE